MSKIKNISWGERVKIIRSHMGLTQDEFARRIGMQTRSAVCQLEKGHREPKGALLLLLIEMEKNLGKCGNSC